MPNRLIDLSGKSFGNLTVIKRAHNKNNEPSWECRCNCGKITIVTGSNLRYNKTRNCFSCGRTLPVGVAARKRIYNIYRKNAIKQNRSFLLTLEEFVVICQKPCVFCGCKPEQKASNNINKNSCNGDFVYNGIDRIDNNIGYEIDNCQACCSVCNFMKQTTPQGQFVSHVKKISNHLFGGIHV